MRVKKSGGKLFLKLSREESYLLTLLTRNISALLSGDTEILILTFASVDDQPVNLLLLTSLTGHVRALLSWYGLTLLARNIVTFLSLHLSRDIAKNNIFKIKKFYKINQVYHLHCWRGTLLHCCLGTLEHSCLGTVLGTFLI